MILNGETTWTVSFFVTSILLGVALAMDAFSVSIASGFDEPKMKKSKAFIIAFTFGLFQFGMPLLGWVCVHYLEKAFNVFKYAIPWIALALLLFLGIKMVLSYRARVKCEDEGICSLSNGKKSFFWTLMIQGVATSIDALSVGFTTSEYEILQALVCSGIIFALTFIICIIGVILGKTVGTKIGRKAELVGGIILICIGVFICIKGNVSLFVPPEYIPDWFKYIL